MERFSDPTIRLHIFSQRADFFYGGRICAALAIWWYAKRHKIGFWHLNDALAPTIMLAYSLGRIGCQVSGDGDWGIENPRPNPYSWLPDWVWSYNYPHNVNEVGVLYRAVPTISSVPSCQFLFTQPRCTKSFSVSCFSGTSGFSVNA
ncbi:MAG: prolipoprotein diacylglyceryl transferase [Chitinophagaceae bacterium]|nr:prolipoprotein diacylglyceryl transferase [Chitinophagaceae bacterium]